MPTLEVDMMRDLDEWRPTPQMIRETVAKSMIVAPGLIARKGDDEERRRIPSQYEVEIACKLMREAIFAGRMIDFGYVPNTVIMDCGKRAGPLYQRGAFVQPFHDPWVFMHSWEMAVAIYLVNPLEQHKASGADFEAVELMAGKYLGDGLLVIGDRVWLTTDGRDVDFYGCNVAPCAWRFVPGAESMNNGGTPEQAAAGNVLDPVMTALLILATVGVRRETIEPSPKLNKARAKSGKPPIPPYDVVHSEEYVTALSMRGKRFIRGEDQGGTHHSPVPHLRRGHLRTYESGKVSLIHDTLVRVSPEAREAFKAARTHYSVRP